MPEHIVVDAGAVLDVRTGRSLANHRILIDGRVPVNPHGGSLSEGGTQGAGHLHEACLQLRGQANERQVTHCRAALVTSGGFYFNSQGMLLRSGD